ncbi:MAG: T9SS type A sorting domain-containing protein [candidate division WOR-3 bacterium]
MFFLAFLIFDGFPQEQISEALKSIDSIHWENLVSTKPYAKHNGFSLGQFINKKDCLPEISLLKDNVGDSVDCLKFIPLYETDITEERDYSLNNLRISPNPFNHYIKIEYPNRERVAFEYRLYDITGRGLQKQRYNGCKIDTAQLPQGVYFICLEKGENKVIKMIVKIK